jgi:ubiquinone/menaquinone biosynthesis C-methylase UbiE
VSFVTTQPQASTASDGNVQGTGSAMSAADATAAAPRTGPLRFILVVLSRFFELNRRLSGRVDKKLNPDHGDLHRSFLRAVETELQSLPPGAVVVDIGGGRQCAYSHAVPQHSGIHLVAVDISPEELAANQDVTDRRVANVAEGLPFANAEVDLIVSQYCLEHVDGVPQAAQHMSRVLKSGGKAIHFMPCRYSTFGVAARVLPFGPLLKLLHFVSPETVGKVEFDVHYDHCYPKAIEGVMRDAGFRRVTVEASHISAAYFFPVFPLYLLVWAYESVVRRLGARSLMAYMMVTAER